jgi:hypothetical protein
MGAVDWVVISAVIAVGLASIWASRATPASFVRRDDSYLLDEDDNEAA